MILITVVRNIANSVRICTIHTGVEKVQLVAVRSLCNMAYDAPMARARLRDPSILAALIGAMAAHPDAKDIEAKSSEAVARIVLSESHPEVEAGASPVSAADKGLALSGLFAAAMPGESSWHTVALRLVAQLLANEVIKPPAVAQQFAEAADAARGSGDGTAAAALGWRVLPGIAIESVSHRSVCSPECKWLFGLCR